VRFRRVVSIVATLVLVALVDVTTAAAALPASAAASATPPPAATDPARAAEYWLDEYGVRAAWQTTRGKGATIAVIDTGIGRAPVEFSGAVVGGADFSGAGSSDGRTPVGAVDANHGSWVASLAAARGTGADTGMIGVAPEANLLSLSIGFGAASAVPFVPSLPYAPLPQHHNESSARVAQVSKAPADTEVQSRSTPTCSGVR
jgi:subtilisin family serine protease